MVFSSSLGICTSEVASGSDGQDSATRGLATVIAFASSAPPLVTHTLLQDVHILLHVPRVSPRMSQRVEASHLEGLQPSDVMLCHWPRLCTVQKARQYHCLKNLHSCGLAEVMTSEDFPPLYLVHFASLLEPHCYFFLYLGTLSHLTAQVKE